MNKVLFNRYLTLLLKWNKVHNLTSITEPDAIWSRHFEDSLSLLPYIGESGRLLDLGSGGGFPGIPLKIEKPGLEVVLVEATGKKVNFLNEVIRQLDLKNITTVKARAEEESLLKQIGQFDYVVSRATWKLGDYLKIADRFVKSDGCIIAMKSAGVEKELDDSEKEVKKLGLKLSQRISYKIENLERLLLIYQKK